MLRWLPSTNMPLLTELGGLRSFEGFRPPEASFKVKGRARPETKNLTMKQRLHFLIAILLVAASLVTLPTCARADETNDAKRAKPEKKIFIFDGGRPLDFILAMDRHFRTRLEQILSIPSSLARAQVPKMKISTEKPKDALEVYNHLEDPTLGQWKYGESSSADPWDPSVLALIPDRNVALKTGAKVKALSLRGLPENSRAKLMEDIEVGRKFGEDQAERLGGDRYQGSVHIQKESNILIAAGSEAFIEMVESVVAAHRDNSNLNH